MGLHSLTLDGRGSGISQLPFQRSGSNMELLSFACFKRAVLKTVNGTRHIRKIIS